VKSKLPIFEDGLDVWHVLHAWFSGYIDLFYGNDDDVKNDAELQQYWKFRNVPQYAKAMPALSKTALVNQITRAVFDVTAMHEFVGNVVSYTTDPAGAALQVRPSLNMADLQQFVQVNSLVAGTGMPMPMLVPSGQAGDLDWFQLLDPPSEISPMVEQLYKKLMDDLRTVSNTVRARNASGTREHPFSEMDPLTLERSLSL